MISNLFMYIMLRALGSHTPILVFCYQCMRELGLFKTWSADFFSDLDVRAVSYNKMCPETFNISYESTQNKVEIFDFF